MPFLSRVDRRIWWLTVSKAVDRSSKMSNEDMEAALESFMFCVRKAENWLNTTRSCVFAMKGRRETGI